MRKQLICFTEAIILTMACMLCINHVNAQSQQIVSGTVTDVEGKPIIGATLKSVTTSSIHTTTDANGTYTLTNIPANDNFEVSFVGYQTQVVSVDNRKVIDIVLQEDDQVLDEVVVIGYGTQKKVNLSGSVVAIDMEELVESRPISNISQGLAGLAAGVSINSPNNRPGEDNATITIRGQGTLNSSAPLIIIDGTEGNINSVTPQDIESMSILKDAASSAIYGSRAANGVILITTKQGKSGKARVEYNGYISRESVARNFEMVSNYADFMELMNEGYQNSGFPANFTDDVIQLWRSNEGKDALKYPNTNLMDDMFTVSDATNHNLSISGGGDKVRFYTSFGYLNTPGVMDNSGFDKYSTRVNLDFDVASWLTLGTNLNGYFSSTDPGTDKVGDTFGFAFATTPGMVFRAPDGRYGGMNNDQDDGQAAGNNPLFRMNNGKGLNERKNMKMRFHGTLTPFKGFSLTGSFNYDYTNKKVEAQPNFIDLWNFQTDQIQRLGTGRTSIANRDYNWNRYLMDAVATYENQVSKLNYKVMAGANQELYRYNWFTVQRYDLLSPDLGAINGAIGESSSSGTTTEWAMHSYFGRMNLDWDDTYLVEFNLRADGSSRFSKANRWGYFPSASVAWRVEQEPFMAPLRETWLSNLKVRGSYGSLGNNILDSSNPSTGGNYISQPTYSQSNYILNDVLQMGIAQTNISNSNVTWEKTYIANVGLDFGVFKNRLSGTVEYFHKNTKDILIGLPAPLLVGTASIPPQNAGVVLNKGVEITLGWQDQTRDFSYFINTNFTFLKNEVTKFKGKERSLSGANMILEGYPINTQFGLVVDRLVQNQADLDYVQGLIDNAPINPGTGQQVNPFSSFRRPELGDLLYRDMNGDGIINDDDRVVIGNGPNPEFVFGFNLGASYKGFDFAVLLQGATGVETYFNNEYFRPLVRHGYQINKTIADGRYYTGMTGNAKYPRLLEYADNRNTRVSDLWLQDRSFLKVRNIQLGYSLPKQWVGRAGIERIRVYGSLENFFVFTSYDGLDPEMGSINYPTMKQAVLGINVSF